MSWYNHPGFSCCGGPFNGGNYPRCSSVGSKNEFVYDPILILIMKHRTFTTNLHSTSTRRILDSYLNQNSDNFPQTSPSSNNNIFVVNIAGVLTRIFNELAEFINTSSWNHPAFHNNDEDDDEDYTIAITPEFSITDSLSMGDEHLSTISEKESNELIKSSVENQVPNPSEYEDLSDIESECDVPVCNDFATFSNSLFDADDNFSSSDDESFSDENVSKEIYSNPLFDKEISSIKIDPHHFNADSDLIKSLLNQDSLIISSPKFDSLLEEFSDELAHIDLIPPGINEADFDLEE
nr:hypothetical protein [Tanacetum cinerariifolium]